MGFTNGLASNYLYFRSLDIDDYGLWIDFSLLLLLLAAVLSEACLTFSFLPLQFIYLLGDAHAYRAIYGIISSPYLSRSVISFFCSFTCPVYKCRLFLWLVRTSSFLSNVILTFSKYRLCVIGTNFFSPIVLLQSSSNLLNGIFLVPTHWLNYRDLRKFIFMRLLLGAIELSGDWGCVGGYYFSNSP